jgi:hypothetical protein
MSPASRCAFCAKLPAAANRRAGRPGKCPLCKGDLVIAGGGVTYRLTDAAEAAPCRSAGPTLLFAGVGVALLLVGIFTVRALIGSGIPVERDGGAVQLAQAAGPVALERRPMRTSPWEDQKPAREPLPAPAVEEMPRPAPARVALAQPPAPPAREKIGPPAAEAESPTTLAAARPAPLLPPTRYPDKAASEEDFRLLLAHVPEVALDQKAATVRSPREARTQLTEQANSIQEQTSKDADAFVKRLEATRADLAGLPFLKGKDCRLGESQAKNWDELSRGIRAALAGAGRSSRSASPSTSFNPGPDLNRFFAALDHRPTKAALQTTEGIPALLQLLQAEHLTLRLSLIQHIEKVKGKAASAALARRAVFDLDPEVRERALAALKGRPAADYGHVLLEAVRYPWAPVAERATEAITALKLKDAVPRLIELLDEPDPDAPFLATVNGKPTPVVREVVRINHFRNCLLCHAPSFDAKDAVRGLVPIPGEPIPVAYYAERSRGLFVRADVTYLRQDFSVMLPVTDSKPWPNYQRYDFLVRTRPLTKQEQAAWEARLARPEAAMLSDHKRLILSTLHELTGEFAGTTAAQWRQLLREIGANRGRGGDAARSVSAKRDSVK